MNFQQGISREQISMFCVETLISADNPVRVIDLFVDQLDLNKLGFSKTICKQEGRPPYYSKDILKLYYYGYLNRIRSSRKLETECERNVEVWWLMRQLRPAYHTIADFRKNNSDALKKAFKTFVSFLKGEDMFSKELIGIDGTKLRAQNNKKNNFNEDKLKKHLANIEEKIETYIKELDDCDAAEDKQASELKKKEVRQKLDILKERKQNYEQLNKELIESETTQISTVDKESRLLTVKDNIAEVSYNIQAVSDSKHSIIVEFDTINESDQHQLSPMACKAMEALGVQEITAEADKGYHVGKQLQACKENGITTLVAYPERNTRAKQIDTAYQTDKFIYNAINDTYSCPQGAMLTTNGESYEKKRKNRTTYLIKRYSTPQCKCCPAKHLCTAAKQGRQIERSEYQEVINENNKRVDLNGAIYKKRQQISEHPFGTIKRGWGYSYTLLRGIKKVNGEMAIIFTMYNLRRAMSILGVTELINRLKKWKPAYYALKIGLIKALYARQNFAMYIRA